MSAYAKSVVAAVAAVLIAGVTSWQAVAADGFRLVDLLPIGTATAGATLTYLVPNVPELPWAKGAVSGALAVLTAMATLVTGNPAEVDVANLLIAGLGALLTWYVPNIGPGIDVGAAARALVGQLAARTAPVPLPADGREFVDDLRDMEQAEAAAPVSYPPTAPVSAVGTWTPATPAALATEPTPIGAEAEAASTGRTPPVSSPTN